ncbi:MAG: undecaprenyl-diphosphate phosphatase [Pseudomonadota bacterium]
MALYHLVLIALIQGITEFLPVSSSGHLILLPGLTGMPDQGNVIDVAAHVGTLGAVLVYFWADVKTVLFGLTRLARRKVDTQGAWLALCMIVATVPVVILGLGFKLSGLDDALRSITVIGWTMMVFGVLLYWVDQRAAQTRGMDKLTLKDALSLGVWQALALIPGTSRSGIVITGALGLGFTRTQAARVAMLMSVPTILASGALSSLDLIGGQVPWRDAGIVAGLSFVAAFGALALMMKLLKSVSFTPYVIYRVVLGAILLIIGYTGALGF